MSENYPAIVQAITKGMEDYNKGVAKAQGLAEHMQRVEVGTTPADVVYQGRKLRLLHYRPMTQKTHPVPLLIVYALINRYYAFDLQPDRSWVRNLLQQGFDIYMVDWGTPEPLDKHITFDDYVNRYLDALVDIVRDRSGQERISMQGYCMGGSMSVMYASLHQEKIKNLLTIAPVIDTEKDTTVLGNFSKHLDVDLMVDNLGNVPPDFLYLCYSILKPFKQGVQKYINFLKHADEKDFVENFLRVEKWLYDTPPIAGDTFRQWIKDIYQKNLLVKNQMKLGNKLVDLSRISVPLFNVCATDDHLVSPECSIPLNYHVSSEDESFKVYPTGHIGMIASVYSQKNVLPEIGAWLKERSVNGA